MKTLSGQIKCEMPGFMKCHLVPKCEATRSNFIKISFLGPSASARHDFLAAGR